MIKYWLQVLFFAICMLALAIFNEQVSANCAGCCSGHGGVVFNGIETSCADYTSLSNRCSTKGCSVDQSGVMIGAWNVEKLGIGKINKSEALRTIVNVISNFDIIAIQEIRDRTHSTVPTILNELSAHGLEYSSVISKRLGYTRMKEQYAYFYDRSKIQPIRVDLLEDVDGIIHRPPFLMKFKYLDLNVDYTAVVIHIDPDNVTTEIDRLGSITASIKYGYGTENLIIMGDMNLDCKYANPDNVQVFKNPNGWQWAIPDEADTTVMGTHCAYDRIITSIDVEIVQSGVYRFDMLHSFNILPRKVSDHYPVYTIIR